MAKFYFCLICFSVEVDDVKRVSTVINTVYNEKVKASKQNKGKKKAAGKAKLNAGQGSIAVSFLYIYSIYKNPNKKKFGHQPHTGSYNKFCSSI